MVTREPYRIVFFGTPEFAVPTLEALLHSRHLVVGVVTQPDRPRGRGYRVTDPPVKVRAAAARLPVLQPERLKDGGFLDALTALGADIGVATTGVAGPEAHDGKPVGTVYIGIATDAGTTGYEYVFSGSRAEIRGQACGAALERLLEVLAS